MNVFDERFGSITNKFILNIIFIMFFILGLIGFIFMYFIDFNTIPKDNRVYTTGVISRIDSDGNDYKVYVDYSIDKDDFTEELNYHSYSMKKGKKIKIYYNKDEVTTISCDEADSFIKMFYIIPIVFSVIGLIGLFFIDLFPLIRKKKSDGDIDEKKK